MKWKLPTVSVSAALLCEMLLKKLEAVGLLEIKSHKGTFVSLICLEQIVVAIFMRENIEKAIIKS